MVPRTLNLGRRGEDVAADYMRENGYNIRDRNWSCRRGELDLVCSHGRDLVFVEVKTRKKGSMLRAAESLSPKQQAKLARAASIYLSMYNLWSRSCRFDLVALEVDANDVTLEHVQNAFDLGQALGDSHTAWQPW